MSLKLHAKFYTNMLTSMIIFNSSIGEMLH